MSLHDNISSAVETALVRRSADRQTEAVGGVFIVVALVILLPLCLLGMPMAYAIPKMHHFINEGWWIYKGYIWVDTVSGYNPVHSMHPEAIDCVKQAIHFLYDCIWIPIFLWLAFVVFGCGGFIGGAGLYLGVWFSDHPIYWTSYRNLNHYVLPWAVCLVLAGIQFAIMYRILGDERYVRWLTTLFSWTKKAAFAVAIFFMAAHTFFTAFLWVHVFCRWLFA